MKTDFIDKTGFQLENDFNFPYFPPTDNGFRQMWSHTPGRALTLGLRSGETFSMITLPGYNEHHINILEYGNKKHYVHISREFLEMNEGIFTNIAQKRFDRLSEVLGEGLV